MAPSAAGGGVQSGAMEGMALEASPSPFPLALRRTARTGPPCLPRWAGAVSPWGATSGTSVARRRGRVSGGWRPLKPPRSTPAAALWPFPRLLGCCCCRRSCCRSHRRTQGHTCPKVIPALPHGGGEGGGGPYLPSQASCFVRGGPYWMEMEQNSFARHPPPPPPLLLVLLLIHTLRRFTHLHVRSRICPLLRLFPLHPSHLTHTRAGTRTIIVTASSPLRCAALPSSARPLQPNKRETLDSSTRLHRRASAATAAFVLALPWCILPLSRP